MRKPPSQAARTAHWPVSAHRAFVAVANLDGQTFQDLPARDFEIRREELADFGPAPAVVHQSRSTWAEGSRPGSRPCPEPFLPSLELNDPRKAQTRDWKSAAALAGLVPAMGNGELFMVLASELIGEDQVTAKQPAGIPAQRRFMVGTA